MPTGDRPIGYWLKHLHDLIDAQFDAMLADLGVGRRHWQVLQTLSGGAHTRHEIEQALAPFWSDGGPGMDELLTGPQGLITRGEVVEGPDGGLRLSDLGRGTHAGVVGRVGQTRDRLLTGLTPEQYVETVRVLSVMAANLEPSHAPGVNGS
ncbi:MAG TPA: hypothetical protein VK453_08955 [Micromonosporaceae bacterium]|nr:hypothetical protein [Micromonosporaceae bacterium]